jgi:hypothetical protein
VNGAGDERAVVGRAGREKVGDEVVAPAPAKIVYESPSRNRVEPGEDGRVSGTSVRQPGRRVREYLLRKVVFLVQCREK